MASVKKKTKTRRAKSSGAVRGGDLGSATYVYCVLKSAKKKAPSLGRAPRGLEGADEPRLLEVGGDYWLVAATAPLSRYAAKTIDTHLRDIDWVASRAAEHEAIVEHALTLGDGVTVIPMKLFTLFSTDERAADHVRGMKRSLDRVALRIEGCEEWGLRILFDEARAARAAQEEARKAKVVTGTSFLLRKKALDEERRSLGASGAALTRDLFDRLSKISRRAERRAAPNRELAGRVLLDAVFLVPRASVKKIKTTVASSAKQLVEEGFDITLSGPWPAYSFIGTGGP